MALLEIKNLYASIGDKEILKNFSLSIDAGQTHVIMGPNGSGKSTLSNVIMGNPTYQIHSGHIFFKGKEITHASVNERACAGLFLAMQYPTELPGVGLSVFLKEAINAQLKAKGKSPLDAVAFIKRLKTRATALDVSDEMLKRPVNVGCSGGEKKKLETLQMAFLEPDFCILDEMDSGLDIDALRVVANGVNVMKEAHRSFLLITHYQRLLDYIQPDVIHIMVDGHIVQTGDKSLALQLEKTGYEQFK